MSAGSSIFPQSIYIFHNSHSYADCNHLETCFSKWGLRFARKPSRTLSDTHVGPKLVSRFQ